MEKQRRVTDVFSATDFVNVLQSVQQCNLLEKAAWSLNKSLHYELAIPLTVVIKASMSQKLRKRLLARRDVCTLELKGKCKGTIDLPHTIKKLIIGKNFPIKSLGSSLPGGLQEVEYAGCQGSCSEFIVWMNALPASLHTLKLTGCVISSDTWSVQYPLELKKLSLYHCAYTTHVPLPPELESLVYYNVNTSDTSAPLPAFPASLQHLSVTFTPSTVIPCTLPEGLKSIHLQSILPLPEFRLPVSLEELTVRYCSGQLPTILPNKLKKVHVIGSYHYELRQDWHSLPNSLEVLDLRHFDSIARPLPPFPDSLKELSLPCSYRHEVRIPHQMEQLTVGRSLETNLDNLPASLHKLELVGKYGHNRLPVLHEGLRILIIESKYICALGTLPTTLKVLKLGQQYNTFTTSSGIYMAV
jgi:hypothetical protein